MTKSITVSSASEQVRGTPQCLVDEIENRFGVAFLLDLAANSDNNKCDAWIGECEGALSVNWLERLKGLRLDMGMQMDSRPACGWLNPPFKSVGPWMEKCKLESAKGMKIISLTLSSLGSNWYRDHVEGQSLSLILRERVTFEGCVDPFPKELMITLWGFGMTGLGFWSRKQK